MRRPGLVCVLAAVWSVSGVGLAAAQTAPTLDEARSHVDVDGVLDCAFRGEGRTLTKEEVVKRTTSATWVRDRTYYARIVFCHRTGDVPGHDEIARTSGGPMYWYLAGGRWVFDHWDPLTRYTGIPQPPLARVEEQLRANVPAVFRDYWRKRMTKIDGVTQKQDEDWVFRSPHTVSTNVIVDFERKDNGETGRARFPVEVFLKREGFGKPWTFEQAKLNAMTPEILEHNKLPRATYDGLQTLYDQEQANEEARGKAANELGQGQVALALGQAYLKGDDVAGKFSEGLVYASGARASSTNLDNSWVNEGYEATQATGAPNMFPKAGKGGGGWSPKEVTSSEWLEVDFPPTQARYVIVYEVDQPGRLRKVTTGDGQPLWASSEERLKSHGRAAACCLELSQPLEISRLKLFYDPSLRSASGEAVKPCVDAVALVGGPAGKIATPAAAPKPAPKASSPAPAPSRAPAPTASKAPEPSPAAAAPKEPNGRIDKRELDRFPTDGQVFATKASASSTYGRGYEAQEATGAPRVFPRMGDNRHTWACENRDSKAEWLELEFPPTEAEFVLIYETADPGAIRRVLVDGQEQYATSDKPSHYTRSQVLWIRLPEAKTVQKVRIELDASLTGSWPEIDAVALVKKGSARE